MKRRDVGKCWKTLHNKLETFREAVEAEATVKASTPCASRALADKTQADDRCHARVDRDAVATTMPPAIATAGAKSQASGDRRPS